VALVVCLLLLLSPTLARAQTVEAVWDPNPDEVDFYEVCVGTFPKYWCNVKFAAVDPSERSLAFTARVGVWHYVAVRAVNGFRSPYTKETAFTIASISPLVDRTSRAGVEITSFVVRIVDPDKSTLTFSHTGLPIGLSLNAATGRIRGMPRTTGTYNVTIFVKDPLATVSRSFRWTITGTSIDAIPPRLTITSHASGLVVTSATQTIRGTATDAGAGGKGIASVKVNGMPAVGAKVTGSTVANWSKAVTLRPGDNTITVEAVDGVGNTQMRQITLVLGASSAPPPTQSATSESSASPEPASDQQSPTPPQ
jgi:hypothetical protein